MSESLIVYFQNVHRSLDCGYRVPALFILESIWPSGLSYSLVCPSCMVQRHVYSFGYTMRPQLFVAVLRDIYVLCGSGRAVEIEGQDC